MITIKPFKTLISVTCVFVCSFFALACPASAHSLPGSELVIKQNSSQTRITLSFALEEFVIAAPHLKFVEKTSSLGDLTNSQVKQLSSYFNQHFKIKPLNDEQDDQFISPSLDAIEIQGAFNEHVGQYRRVEAQFSVDSKTLPYNSLFPAVLHFDAILHEIRSHRVAVFYEGEQNSKIKLVDFVYSETNGKPATHLLSPNS